MSMVLSFVRHATQAFVKAEAVREAISLALVSGKNLILFGPGGHGKSEMTSAVMSAIEGASVFVQSFGEGMDEARLYGGINLKALNDADNPVIEYHPDRSFLAADLAVFEELFDAPTSVLLSLKDTLTAGTYRNGAQQFKMRTQTIVCATNREPGEVAEIGAAAQALIERFPLQLRVAWDSYSANDFLEMFESIETSPNGHESVAWTELQTLKAKAKSVRIEDGIRRILAEVIASAVANGVTISPRTAMHSQDIVRAAAAINGHTIATKDDLLAIKYLPGCEEIATKISQEIEEAVKRAGAEQRMREAETKLRMLQTEFQSSAGSPIKLLQIALKGEQFSNELAQLTVTDNLVDRRKAVRDATAKLIGDAQQAALRATRI